MSSKYVNIVNPLNPFEFWMTVELDDIKNKKHIGNDIVVERTNQGGEFRPMFAEYFLVIACGQRSTTYFTPYGLLSLNKMQRALGKAGLKKLFQPRPTVIDSFAMNYRRMLDKYVEDEFGRKQLNLLYIGAGARFPYISTLIRCNADMLNDDIKVAEFFNHTVTDRDNYWWYWDALCSEAVSGIKMGFGVSPLRMAAFEKLDDMRL